METVDYETAQKDAMDQGMAELNITEKTSDFHLAIVYKTAFLDGANFIQERTISRLMLGDE